MGKCIGKAEGAVRNEEEEPVAVPREHVAIKTDLDDDTQMPTISQEDDRNAADHNFSDLISEGEEICLGDLNGTKVEDLEDEEATEEEEKEGMKWEEEETNTVFPHYLIPTEMSDWDEDEMVVEEESIFSSKNGVTDVEFVHDADENTLVLMEGEQHDNDGDDLDHDGEDNDDDEHVVYDEDSEGVLVVNVMCLSNEDDNNANDETTTTTINDKEESRKRAEDEEVVWEDMGVTNSTMQMDEEYLGSEMLATAEVGVEVGDILREVNKRHSKQVDKLMYEMKDCNATLSELIQTQLTTQKQIIDQLCKKRKKAKKKEEKERKRKAKRIKKSQVSATVGEDTTIENDEDNDNGDDGIYQMVLQQNQEIKQLMEMVITSVNEQRKENASVTSSTCQEILQGQDEIKKLIQQFIVPPGRATEESLLSRVDKTVPVLEEAVELRNSQALCSDWLHSSGRIDAASFPSSHKRLADNTGLPNANSGYQTCVNHFDTSCSAGGKTTDRYSKKQRSGGFDNCSTNGWTNGHSERFSNQMSKINAKYTKQRNEIYDRYNKRSHGSGQLLRNELDDRYSEFTAHSLGHNQTYGNFNHDTRFISKRRPSEIFNGESGNELNSTGDSVPSLSLHSNASMTRSQEKREIIYTEVMGQDKEIVSERIERLTRENQRIDSNINRVINKMHSTAAYVPVAKTWNNGANTNELTRKGASKISEQVWNGDSGMALKAPVTYSGEIKELRDSWVKELGTIKSLHSTVVDQKKAEKMEAKRKKKELDDFMKNYLRL